MRLASRLCALALAVACQPAFAQTGDLGGIKTVTFIVGTSAGAGYDFYARTVASFLSRHLPGNPKIVVQNLPSAAGVTLANQIFNTAPNDGSVIGMSPASFVLSEVIDPVSSRYRSQEFNWIGTLTTMTDVLAVLKTSGITSLQDAKARPVTIGASGKLSNLSIYPSLANALLGTQFKIVHGYPGGNEINLAMDNGEVQGRTNQWDSWIAQRPHWIKEEKLTYLLQFGPKVQQLAGTPRLAELVSDPAKLPMIDLIEVIELVGRSIYTSPKIAPDKLEVWRKAFDAAVSDPEYLARMRELGLDGFSRRGADLQIDLQKALANAPAVHRELKQTIDLQ